MWLTSCRHYQNRLSLSLSLQYTLLTPTKTKKRRRNSLLVFHCVSNRNNNKWEKKISTASKKFFHLHYLVWWFLTNEIICFKHQPLLELVLIGVFGAPLSFLSLSLHFRHYTKSIIIDFILFQIATNKNISVNFKTRIVSSSHLISKK